MPILVDQVRDLTQAIHRGDLATVSTLTSALAPLQGMVAYRGLILGALAHPDALALGLLDTLIAAGADVNAVADQTHLAVPLERALDRRRWCLVERLLDAGACPGRKLNQHVDVAIAGLVTLALHGQGVTMRRWIRALPIFLTPRVLREAAAATFAAWSEERDRAGGVQALSPVQRLDVTEAFVSAGLELGWVSRSSIDQRTVLHHAVAIGDAGLVAYLLAQGAPTDGCSFEKLPSPIDLERLHRWAMLAHLAVHTNDRYVVEALLHQGVPFVIGDARQLERFHAFGHPADYARARGASAVLLALEAHALRAVIGPLDGTGTGGSRTRERL